VREEEMFWKSLPLAGFFFAKKSQPIKGWQV